MVSGNTYLEAVAFGDTLRELHVLRPDRMQVVPGADGWPEAWDYIVGGSRTRIDGEAVPGVSPILHLKLFHPVNDHYGLSPIEAAATAIDLHNSASRWNKALLDIFLAALAQAPTRSSARPSGALVYSTGGHLSGDQFERLKAELEASFQGARILLARLRHDAGRPLLLEGGIDWNSMSLSPRDMEDLTSPHHEDDRQPAPPERVFLHSRPSPTATDPHMTDRTSRPPEVAREVKFCELDLKAVALDGVFEGYASLFNKADLGHDIVLPGAFRASLATRGATGIKMLYQHDPATPIGVWLKAHEDARGLFVRGRLMTEVAKAREVLALMRTGALDGLSIGFRMVKGARDRFGVRRLEKIDLWEISVVTFPMQTDARVTAVKGGQPPTVREFERWLTQDAGFSRRQAKALMRDGYKGLELQRDAGLASGWERRLITQLAEATRLLRHSL